MFGPSKTTALVAASSLLAQLACAGPASMLPRQVETTAPDCTNLDTNGTIYKGIKEKFEIFCGYDFPGGDYAAFQADTFEDCINACEDDETCVDVAYGFGSHGCYLKDSVSTATANGGVYAARKIPSADAPISCQTPGANNTIYDKDTKNSFQILCDTDYAGEDIAAVISDTFADCIATCDANDACVDVSYGFRTKSCWLKGKATTANKAEGIWTALKKTQEHEEPKTVVTCEDNASNNTIYKSGDSTFLVLCGFDYGGGDMGGSLQPSFADCMDLCAATEDCVDVSYASGSCYMKSTLNTLNPAGWVWTGKKVVETTDPEPIKPELSCVDGAMDGKTFTASSGNQYSIICGREYPGGDLKGVEAATFADCVEACDTTTGCIDVSYVAPACYMKSSLTTLQDAAYVSTALFLGRPADPAPAIPLSCVDSKDNGTTFVTPAGNEYVVLCGVDYFGGDMGMVYTDTFEKCMEACDANDGCIDVGYSGTACYMKNALTSQAPAPWAWNALYLGKAAPASSTTSAPTATSSQELTSTTATVTEEPSTTTSAEETLTTTSSAEESSTTASSAEEPSTTTSSAEETSTTTSSAEETSTTTSSAEETLTTTSAEETSTTTFIEETPTTASAEETSATTSAEETSTSSSESTATSTEEASTTASTEESSATTSAEVTSASTSTEETSATTSVSSTVASETPCSTEPAGKFIPSQDIDIDRSSNDRLTPALQVELNYAEHPGNRILQMELVLITPAVVLENIATIKSVSCTEAGVLVTFTDFGALNVAIATWSAGLPLLITYFEGCNPDTARGFWAPTDHTFAAAPEPFILFTATQKNLTDVATEATLKYGSIDSGVESYTSTTTGAPTEPTAAADQTCAASSTVDTSATITASETSPASTETLEASSTSSETSATSATPTPSDRPLPETLEDLTPGARELYDFILARLPVDAEGNLNYAVPAQKVTELEPAAYEPDDVGKQQELEDMFQEAGLDSPADLVAKASAGVSGVCEAPSATVQRRLLQPSRRIQRGIRARSQARDYEGWLRSKLQARDGWDVACGDFVGGLLGLVGLDETMEGVCAGKDLYDNRDAIKCLFGGCKTSTVITKTTTYDFDYAWSIRFPTMDGWLTYANSNKVLSCVNCGFSVTNIAFSGKIVVSITQGTMTIKSADVTPGISGTANMIVRLQSDGAYSGAWSYNFNSIELGAIQMDSAFKISPSILYGIGVDFSTDSKVDVTGGATFSWNGAVAPINIMSRSVGNQRSWQPAVSLTTPTFTTGATVSIKPYMRWLVKLNVDIYGIVKISPSISSQTVVGIDSTYSYTAANGCPANSLKVNTYLNTANTASFGDGTGAVLYSGQVGNANQCFTVPGLLPSTEEIQSLQAVGGPYCTSFVKYVPPVTVVYSTSTSTVPSTVTSYSTQTVTYTETIWEIPTVTTDFYSTSTVSASTVTVTASDKTPNFSYLNWKRDVAEPTATPTPTGAPAGGPLEKRQAVAQPGMLAGWDATRISYACKQIATGTSTRTARATTTVTSGAVTVSSTVTVNKAGPLETYIWYTETKGRFLGATTETVEGTATQTVCPTPQPTTCFKLKAHGGSWLEGKYMRYSGDGGGFGPDVIDYAYDTFYLSSKGHLMGYTAEGMTLFLGKSFPWAWADYWGQVLFLDASGGGVGAELATCWKDPDPCSKGFQCKVDYPMEVIGMNVMEPVYNNFNEDDWFWGWGENSHRPSWGLPADVLPNIRYVALSFTYEDAPCPCY